VLGPEHLLAVNLVIGDCLLAFVRNEPVDELLAKLPLHMRMLGRVNQDDTVLVEQPFVALHREDEVGLVLERNYPNLSFADRTPDGEGGWLRAAVRETGCRAGAIA